MSLSRRKPNTVSPPVPVSGSLGPGSASPHSFATAQGSYLTAPQEESQAQNGEGTEGEGDLEEAAVVFDFTSSSTFELSVAAGTQVRIVEADDGSGWVKVTDGRGTGLVPAAYIQSGAISEPNSPSHATASHAQANGKIVRGLFAYDAAGDDEISVAVGVTIKLTPGGESFAEGWYEGIGAGGKKGIFPSNYVELV